MMQPITTPTVALEDNCPDAACLLYLGEEIGIEYGDGDDDNNGEDIELPGIRGEE